MAYYGYEFLMDGTRATFWGYLQTALVNMGWELHDDISATVKVYKTNGESGNEPYGYLWLDAGTSSYIQFCIYQYWNSATHTGIRPKYYNNTAASSRITSFQSAYPVGIYGDKDFILIVPSAASYSEAQVLGHIPVRYDNNVTGAHGTAGTAGTLTIASSAGQGIGKRIQIAGDGGCDSLVITSAPAPTTRLVAALPRNYGTGAKIGAPASTFCITYSNSANLYPCSGWGDSGTAGTSTISWGAAKIASPNITSVDFFNEGKYYFAPFMITTVSASTPGAAIGMLNEHFLGGYAEAAFGIMALNNDGSFPTVSMVEAAYSNVLIDSSKSWVVNEHAGKLCCITNNDGVGFINRIASNTVDTLTLEGNWSYTYMPSGGSEYKIVDRAWRASGCLGGIYIEVTTSAAAA